MTEAKIKYQADTAWRFLFRNPRMSFEQWAKSKDFAPGDRERIKKKMIKMAEEQGEGW